ncbi:putative bifunctional diguanylate cyclase/phosphodiesterase [Pseudogemmobacter sp. W21_MBD1_M6]|uniref:putative bifunctional diguanylate cyclase/phosphodiesterase n=1 Tax=Pseudogemmobacter sp. W21_MBD1_M6 TaxID=3240271 RepID=UPI003F9A3790
MPLATGPASTWIRRVARHLYGPHLLAFVPALTLCAYWLGGEAFLVVSALIVPAVLAITSTTWRQRAQSGAIRPDHSGLVSKNDLISALDRIFHPLLANGHGSICLVVDLDDLSVIANRFGHRAAEDLVRQSIDRLRGQLRALDIVTQLDGGRFAIALAPILRADLETAIQLASRIQSALSEAISVDAISVYTSCSVGFCLSGRSPQPSGDILLDAAVRALTEARNAGQGSIRAYSKDMDKTLRTRNILTEDIGIALEAGQFAAWFQPQISTDTGQVTGFEALARWIHPERGIVAPADFLPAIEHAGLLERLGEVMLYQSLTAIKAWDKAGVEVPVVGVNFSGDELRNPNLVSKLRWELDKFDLLPARLCVEILETVISTSDDDTVARNIAELSRMGCRIDLDDFGTGHASIANIRRFAVHRIKIDRSFVTKVDEDPEQQRMLSAILTMAERLDLDTLAEGVETLGEHAMLSQLGCGHVQGYALARPMPFEETIPWIAAHSAKLSRPPTIGRRIG